MTKPRVLIFIGSLSVGGGQMVVAQLINNIDKAKIDISVLCYEGKTNSSIENEVEKCCPVQFLNESGKISIGKTIRIFHEISKIKPDVVHVHLGGMVYAVPWALLHNIPLLITVHTKPEKAFPPAVLPLIKWGVKKGKIRMAAVSEENRTLIQNHFGIMDKRIVCINNGIEIDKYFRKKHKEFTFINVSRQDENKNQSAIINAFGRLRKENPNTKLILAGDGPTHKQLINQVKELDLEQAVVFPGMVPKPEYYYAISDVYVQSSHREAMPMSVLEALATGLPIISTNVGGMKDVIKENGILIPDHDINALYNAMKYMVSVSDEQVQMMSRKSKEIVMQYSASEMAERYMYNYINMKSEKTR